MAKQLMLLMLKNEHYAKRFEIKGELRRRGMFGKTYPKNLEQVPQDMRAMFEMVAPDITAIPC